MEVISTKEGLWGEVEAEIVAETRHEDGAHIIRVETTETGIEQVEIAGFVNLPHRNLYGKSVSTITNTL